MELKKSLTFIAVTLLFCAGAVARTQPIYNEELVRAEKAEKRDLLGSLLGGILGTVFSTLTAIAQNGGAVYGNGKLTIPTYRSDGGTKLSNGWPWGLIDVFHWNPYTSAPGTGVTRSYDFHVAECTVAPDGVEVSSAICINGQTPGPLIEANYGDMISVTVHNDLKSEGTSIHWHGFLQTLTSAQDGVPGVQQCPIAPGSSYTYNFRAVLYGSSWYHCHYSSQYGVGGVGPIVIHGPNQLTYDADLGPVMLMDWYHTDYHTIVSGMMRSLKNGGPIEPPANGNLINGKNTYDCSKTSQKCTANAPTSVFNFTPGKKHRLRLVNVGAGAIQKFTIDGHTMSVIANDFVPITPYTTSMIALGPGQRADVTVEGTGKEKESYWMRSSINGCSVNDGKSYEALAAIYYTGADATKKPTTKSTNVQYNTVSPFYCGNDDLAVTVPTYPIAAGTPATTQNIDIDLKSNGSNMVYTVNGQTYRTDYNNPILGMAQAGNLNFDKARNVFNFGSNSSVRLVIRNFSPTPHPLHLHGHNLQVLTSGFGSWDGKTITRASNPQRRDVQIMFPANGGVPSYLVLQYAQDNPGVWPFHCHFAWHSGMGLFMNFLERPTDIRFLFSNIPSLLSQTCNTWNAFTKANKLLTAIDSGA